jgi:predicted nucleotidyltransferase
MARSPTTVTSKDIQKVAQQIVEQFHPQKVILFGSYANGTPTENSDVDLLVLMETKEQPLHTAARIAAAIDHPFASDIVVRRPLELAASLARQGGFATEVMTTGIVLYEA